LLSLYANSRPASGHIPLRHGADWVDLVTAPPRQVLEVRKTTSGWVSVFLRVIPLISGLVVVMQPLLDLGRPGDASAAKAAQLL
ncbi:phosphonate C-P lyase system protein PhnL, partial [Klebsiella pneumoniae]|nr:phosphonate C-P lyase system protein PhnL [Klebsiella pneumoniae]